MIPDRLRLPLALLALVWLTIMAAQYTALVQERAQWIDKCQDNPEACDQRRVFLSLVDVLEVHADHYVVLKTVTEITIDGDTTDLEVGETISVIARFEGEDDRLVETSRKRHPWRWLKKLLGVVGILATAGVVIGGFRIEGRRVHERPLGGLGG